MLRRQIYEVLERTSVWVSGVFTDADGDFIPVSSLSTVTLTLYDEGTKTILNSRNAQNVLNNNGVSINSDGVMVWIMVPDDNAILNASAVSERHVALFEWTWGTPARYGKMEIGLQVINLNKVPSTP